MIVSYICEALRLTYYFFAKLLKKQFTTKIE